MNANAIAMEKLAEWVDHDLVEAIKKLMDTREAYWVWDPEVRDVLGFKVDGTVEAVLYLQDEDLELNEELFYSMM